VDLGLAGRTCVVTGGSQGIGRGVAEALTREGARVAIVARSEAPLLAAADALEADGLARPHVVVADVTAPDGPVLIRDRVFEAFGAVDVLVNSAGGSRKLAWDAPDSAWDEGIALNFHSLRRLTNAFLPGMRSAGYGRVVNVTGTSEPLNINAAASAKAATHAWAKALSREIAPDGVTINSVAPGIIRSQQVMEKVFVDDDERAEVVRTLVPAGYMGEAYDIACLITFLASAPARYITGTVIHVDGGVRRFAF
jgi:3-oxoacyl-[acyl-carrier protein] reductase